MKKGWCVQVSRLKCWKIDGESVNDIRKKKRENLHILQTLILIGKLLDGELQFCVAPRP